MMAINFKPQRKPGFSLKRRRLLAAAMGAPLLSLVSCSSVVPLASAPKRLVSAYDDPQHHHYVGVFNTRGEQLANLETALRCHGFATHGNRAVAFARRPGTQMYAFDSSTGSLIATADSPQNRHFFGHGCFTADGRYLLTSENDYQRGTGVIGVWDGYDFRRLGEFSAHGIEPHDLHLLADGKTLVVANGGIRTHPDLFRRKLNIATMKPSLIYLDSRSERLIDRYDLSDHQLSIRHLAITPDDGVAIAMQYEGPRQQTPPLIGFHRGESRIQLLSALPTELKPMKNYTASISIDPVHRIAGVTCPRGSIINFWDLRHNRYLTSLPIRDAGGIVPAPDLDGFIASTGGGEVFQISTPSLQVKRLSLQANHQWDNHLFNAI